MKEVVSFIYNSNRKIFTHHHISENFDGTYYLFLNPLFDEKKRVQSFQAETARNLFRINRNVFRFDYYGTGDSYGELNEFDFACNLEDIDYIYNYIADNYRPSKIIIFGIRIGASLAVLYAKENKKPLDLLLVEPVILGSEYLHEQRIRRKIFYNLNRMKNASEIVEISGENFEDHQGYLISDNTINFLKSLDLLQLKLTNHKIDIYRLNDFSSREKIKKFVKFHSYENKITLIDVDCPSFWSSMERLDTRNLTLEIIRNK